VRFIVPALLSAILSIAVAGASEQVPNMPDWLRFPLTGKTMFTEIYAGSMSQSVFVSTKPRGFLPPVQYLQRKIETDLSADSGKISREILVNLGVDPDSEFTSPLFVPKPVKAGPHKEFQGFLMEVQNKDGKESNLTCMVFIKEADLIHAIFVQARATSLRDCDKSLMALARSPILFKK
jgi:hypothetical protein